MPASIVISGYYGFGNTGDEAVLAGILATLKHLNIDARVTVLSADPERTMAEHSGVHSVHRYKPAQLLSAIRTADLVISGGGSLLQDVTSARSIHYYLFILQLARFFRRRTMIYAQGIGPLNRPGTRNKVASILNKTGAITVRDTDSQALLHSIGVKQDLVHLTADPSFMVEPDYASADAILAEHGLQEEDFIGVALRPWWKSGDWLPDIARGLTAASKKLGVKLVHIPMQQGEDLAVSEAVDEGTVIHDPGAVRTAKALIGRCRLVVGMRLHSLIFAASEGVPFVPVVYDPKVESFAASVDQDPGIRIESFSASELEAAVVSAWQKQEELQSRMHPRVEEMKGFAIKSGKILQELVS